MTRALATQVLLGRHGIPVELRIGVATGKSRQLEAHAWVECRGRVVVGGSQELSRYALQLVERETRSDAAPVQG